jgi:hypothetical protein
MSWRNLLASIFGDFWGSARVVGLLLRGNRSLLSSEFSAIAETPVQKSENVVEPRMREISYVHLTRSVRSISAWVKDYGIVLDL